MEDFNSKYTGQQVEDLLDQVASGNAGGGGVTDVYIADFTRESLRGALRDGTLVDCDMQALVAAMNANKIILVREREDSSYKGVYVLNGYAEDLLYFSIVDTSGDILWCEGTDYISSSYIDGGSLHLKELDNKQDKLVSGENIKTFNGESLLGEGNITTPTFLRIGDTDDEAKANFIAVANGEKSADYYICSSRVQNTPIHGIATSLDKAGPTNNPVYVRYDIYGSAMSGELGGKLLKITTKLTTATGEITTTYEAILDAKQDTLVSGTNIKTINGESIVGSGDIKISGGSGEQGPQGEKGDKGDKGDAGVGVQSVAQTTISNADGGSNVVTVTLTNGTTSTFTVKNGSKGSQGLKGDKGDTGANGTNGKDGATFTPSVDSAGNLSWSNNKGLANPPTVNIKGPKGDTGEGGEDVVNTPKYIQWDYTVISFGAADEMTPNVKYVCTQPIDTILFEESLHPYDCWHGGVTDLYNEYSIIFEANETDIQAPDYFRWVNGTIPTMENGVRYELSIALMYINNNYIAHAVLTPFKPVE